MSVISIHNLTFGYEESLNNVFDHITLNMDSSWKLGLIGKNGSGKTTLLKILLGELACKGNVISNKNFFYFPYDIDNKNELVLEIIKEHCHKEDWEIMKELNLIDFDTELIYSPFNMLSFGEQTKVMLCSMFLIEDAFLLLDEPTNHLDAKTRSVVSAYLKKKNGFILVSHYRQLLNEVCDHIISINKSTIDVMSGNYDVWKEAFDNREQFEIMQRDKIIKDINRLESASKNTANWSNKVEKSKFNTKNSGLSVDRGYVGHKSAKMMKKAKTIEKRMNRQKEEKENLLGDFEHTFSLKIKAERYRAEKMGYVHNLSLSYYDKEIFGGISFDICSGDRIVLSGKNGCGKTSLIKILLGEQEKSAGEFKINNDVKISYVSQSDDNLKGSLSDYALKNNVDLNLMLSILNKLNVQGDCFLGRIENFSKGQRRKLQLAKSLCEKAHLYIWDEPLNYLDIDSRMQLENLILEYKPTMIFVEHDEAFSKKIANKIIEM